MNRIYKTFKDVLSYWVGRCMEGHSLSEIGLIIEEMVV